MATISAILGIFVYFFGYYHSIGGAVALVLGISSMGLLSMFGAYFIGAAKPSLCSALTQAAVLLAVGIGGAISALAIHCTAVVIALRGRDPTAGLEAAASAVIAAIGLLIDNVTSMSKLVKPAHLAEWLIKLRYDKHFPKLSASDSKEYSEAYWALNRDPTSDSKGQISGWGFASCKRRLTLIQRGLGANNSAPSEAGQAKAQRCPP